MAGSKSTQGSGGNTVKVQVPGQVVRHIYGRGQRTKAFASLPGADDVGIPSQHRPRALLVTVPMSNGLCEFPVCLDTDTPVPAPGDWISVTLEVTATARPTTFARTSGGHQR